MRILYLDLDCCRPDHLGVYGYHRRTSPNIDAIARRGVVFDCCYCSNSPCVPSRASVFSGRFGINNGVVSNHDRGERMFPQMDTRVHFGNRPMLAHHLWQNGIRTVSFSSFLDRHGATWFAPGWQELHTFTRKKGNETAEEVNAAFLPWLRANGAQDNWFVHLHYWDLHCLYRMPDESCFHLFENDPPPDWPDAEALERNLSIYGPRTARDPYLASGRHMPKRIATPEDMKKVYDGYDGAIAYLDRHIGQVFDVMGEMGILEDTAIIISSDHGDSFGEHGQYMDHGIANEAVHHIPAIVYWPGVTQPGRNDGFIYGLDLGPTLCEMLDFQAPEGWDGRSFAAALRNERFDGWPYLIFDHGIYTLTRSVRTRDHLLMQVLHRGLYPYNEPLMLYDIRTEPHQQWNIARENPATVNALLGLIAEWRSEQLGKNFGPDALEASVASGPFAYYTAEKYLQCLLKDGFEDHAADFRRGMGI